MTEDTDFSTEDKALKLLASFHWNSCGKQLALNGHFDPEAAVALMQDLGGNAIEALGLQFLRGNIYLNANQAEKLFRLEGLVLNVCKGGVTR
jgi:hypothetical protein